MDSPPGTTEVRQPEKYLPIDGDFFRNFIPDPYSDEMSTGLVENN